MDILALKELLRPVVGNLKDHCTNEKIPDLCRQLGLPVPKEEGSKRERLHGAFDLLDDADMPEFARTLLAQKVFNPSIRNNIQDLLWADEPNIDIPKRHRRELAEALQPFELFGHWENFKRLLNDLFVFPLDLSEMFSIHETGILGEIHRHFVRNPEDGDVTWLFEKLQIVELSAPRFRRWLEGLVSADVQISIERQLAKVKAVNKVLRTCGAELIHSSDAEGYPVFSLISLRTFRGRPKNIIFASLTKPDIRLSDSLNNEIEILSNPNEVLIYDRPLSTEGLSWRELQAWWADFTREENSEEAKISLYRRLQQSLPNSSPPQKKFFKEFFRQYSSAIYDLPALLPEVWLHWDPKTVSERGAGALLNHRMDFLLLMPDGGRVVIEIDGIQHYSDETGRASKSKYADLVAADRSLKLAGYDIYRFAGVELHHDDASYKIKCFFDALFKYHGIKINF
ncbi:hypothetical protein BAT00_004594 [Salmonella enterica subsp. enterica serovar Falkensee]|nr:hypothetical protein [Salmonella enterica subsp. enterica serovar Falkensee]EDT4976255.1 hypothetical protein [Salmonella enterica subsp. enterica serovar Mbandaka]EEQ0333712.1 hypothetical protein [Salmonella enterica]EBR7945133.1 hypothetical protein [Salmonella enterica subsp. enterica serovar Falkensee]EBV5667093.1 hypothetical protein [Salmonella enterica subsp. enterica serovar Falkensee]